MSEILNRIINFAQWPLAVLLLLITPSLIEIFSYFNFFTLKNACFIAGVLVFFVFRATLDKEVKTSLQTLAHELTHAFFAIITFHKVTSIRVHDEGGFMSFEGKGNWLIIAAPYFFPLFLFLFIVVFGTYGNFFPDNFLTKGYYPLLMSFVLGGLMGAHLDMIGSQVHDKQTDLEKLGILFCLLFIIPANIFVLECVMVYNSRGVEGLEVFLGLVSSINRRYLDMVF